MKPLLLWPRKADPVVATYSIGQRMTWHLSLGVSAVVALMSLSVYFAAATILAARSEDYLRTKLNVVAQVASEAFEVGGLAAVRRDASFYAHRRPQTRVEIVDAADRLVYVDAEEEPFLMGPAPRRLERDIDLRRLGGGVLRLRMQGDTTQDNALLRSLGWFLLLLPVAGGALAAVFTRWRVGHDLSPLVELASQTESITADRLDQRVGLKEVPVELQPWITQFNALMSRLQGSVAQLESFNADVAHELRTPLFAVMGHIEVTLSRQRSAQELKEVLGDSLEQLQKLTSMVQDMLFLARAAQAGTPMRRRSVSLRSVAEDMLEFYRLSLEEAGLRADIRGDCDVDIDVALIQRALSNLIDNAIRHAQAGTTLTIAIEATDDQRARVSVANVGPEIDRVALPRIFDRFFRVDPSRQDSSQHHGLGLAIVAAIARAHGGAPLATHADGQMRVGFEIPMRPAGVS